MARVLNRAEVRGHPPKAHSEIGLARVIRETARLKASSAHDAAKGLNDLLESRMPEVELIDALNDVDNETDFLHHFLQSSSGRRLPPAIQRRNVLAALVAVGCNIGPTRMAAASGLSVWEISEAADWYLLPDALKAAGVDLVNYAIHLPTSQLYGLGDTCSADGMRFYVPVDILAADFSQLLHGRGVTLYAHTAENTMRLHQEPIPCRLREATFVLDGLMERYSDIRVDSERPAVSYPTPVLGGVEELWLEVERYSSN